MLSKRIGKVDVNPETGKMTQVVFEDGQVPDCQVLCFAIGIRARTRAAGIKCHHCADLEKQMSELIGTGMTNGNLHLKTPSNTRNSNNSKIGRDDLSKSSWSRTEARRDRRIGRKRVQRKISGDINGHRCIGRCAK